MVERKNCLHCCDQPIAGDMVFRAADAVNDLRPLSRRALQVSASLTASSPGTRSAKRSTERSGRAQCLPFLRFGCHRVERPQARGWLNLWKAHCAPGSSATTIRQQKSSIRLTHPWRRQYECLVAARTTSDTRTRHISVDVARCQRADRPTNCRPSCDCECI